MNNFKKIMFLCLSIALSANVVNAMERISVDELTPRENGLLFPQGFKNDSQYRRYERGLTALEAFPYFDGSTFSFVVGISFKFATNNTNLLGKRRISDEIKKEARIEDLGLPEGSYIDCTCSDIPVSLCGKFFAVMVVIGDDYKYRYPRVYRVEDLSLVGDLKEQCRDGDKEVDIDSIDFVSGNDGKSKFIIRARVEGWFDRGLKSEEIIAFNLPD